MISAGHNCIEKLRKFVFREKQRQQNDPLLRLWNKRRAGWVERAVYPAFEYVRDKRSGYKVLHVRHFPALLQAVGKVKYERCKEACRKCDGARREKEHAGYAVAFRGQTFLSRYDTGLRPTAFRDEKMTSKKANEIMRARIKACKEIIEKHGQTSKDNPGKCYEMYDDRVVEGILQHYGTMSRWIDAVDNIWVAIWFACHQAWSDEKGYVHYERRDPKRERPENRYCYILLLGIETTGMTNQGVPGLMANDTHQILDLRYALQSWYVRPHIQHGLLMRSMKSRNVPNEDMVDLIQGIVRIDLETALEWLGDGSSVSDRSMFPAPTDDSGYETLLKFESEICQRLENNYGQDIQGPFFMRVM